MAEIRQHSEKGSVFNTDHFKSFNSLKLYEMHLTINLGVELFKGRRDINGLECIWSFSKIKAAEVSWLHSKSLLLIPVKEMEFRYNYRNEILYQLLIEIHFVPIFKLIIYKYA